MGINSKKKQR